MKEKTKDNMCIFFASDYHFEMIAVPYIVKNSGKKNVIILTENNLKETVNNLLERMIIDEVKKQLISGIDWTNRENKLEISKNNLDKKMETLIFIKGKENFVNETNKKINVYLSEINLSCENLEIIDCYDLQGIETSFMAISSRYNKQLNSKGVIAI
jgi:hypothetical protein